MAVSVCVYAGVEHVRVSVDSGLVVVKGSSLDASLLDQVPDPVQDREARGRRQRRRRVGGPACRADGAPAWARRRRWSGTRTRRLAGARAPVRARRRQRVIPVRRAPVRDDDGERRDDGPSGCCTMQ
jgi:hypothetical protein